MFNSRGLTSFFRKLSSPCIPTGEFESFGQDWARISLGDVISSPRTRDIDKPSIKDIGSFKFITRQRLHIKPNCFEELTPSRLFL